MMDVLQPDYQGKLRVKNCSVREMSLTGNEKDDFLGGLNCVAMWQVRFSETVTLRQGELPFLWQYW